MQIKLISGVGFNTGGVIIKKEEDIVNGFAGFEFDFNFGFPSGTTARRFTQGDSVTYEISLTGGMLTPASFLYTATGSAGNDNWYTAAHIRNTSGPSGSGMIGDAASVPEPSTYIAGALLLIPLLLQARRWRRSV